MLEVAVDPHEVALGSFVHVRPNPFNTAAAFYAGDTGGAIIGRHVDIYDWRGRAAQDAWAARRVSVTPAADPGAGNALGQVQAPALSLPAGGMACASSSAGGYQNPFASSTSVVPERIDMGVDYDGTGPIDVLGPGTVTYSVAGGAGWGLFSRSGGHGGAVVYRLVDGPDAGRYVYLTEGIVPLATVGEQVQAGQLVATFTGCIETGWGTGVGANTMAAALGQACASGDPGCVSTACGWSMSQLIAAAGGRPDSCRAAAWSGQAADRGERAPDTNPAQTERPLTLAGVGGDPALLLSGCGLRDPYDPVTTSCVASRSNTSAIGPGEHDGPTSGPAGKLAAGLAQATPRRRLRGTDGLT